MALDKYHLTKRGAVWRLEKARGDVVERVKIRGEMKREMTTYNHRPRG